MKAHILAAAVACGAWGALLQAQPPAETRITAGDLPAGAQRALAETAKGEPVKTITRRVVEGRTVYEVELERPHALNRRFRVTEEGIIVAGRTWPTPDDTGTAPIATFDGISMPAPPLDPMIPVESLPVAVRETIKREASGRTVVDVDRETWQGRTVYEIEFKSPGRNPQIHVAEDGTVVPATASRPAGVGRGLLGLFLGTQLEDTPAAVQASIRRVAQQGAIRDIDVERRSGRRVYEVEFEEGSSIFQIHFAEDGQILHDTRATPSPTARPEESDSSRRP